MKQIWMEIKRNKLYQKQSVLKQNEEKRDLELIKSEKDYEYAIIETQISQTCASIALSPRSSAICNVFLQSNERPN